MTKNQENVQTGTDRQGIKGVEIHVLSNNDD